MVVLLPPEIPTVPMVVRNFWSTACCMSKVTSAAAAGRGVSAALLAIAAAIAIVFGFTAHPLERPCNSSRSSRFQSAAHVARKSLSWKRIHLHFTDLGDDLFDRLHVPGDDLHVHLKRRSSVPDRPPVPSGDLVKLLA